MKKIVSLKSKKVFGSLMDQDRERIPDAGIFLIGVAVSIILPQVTAITYVGQCFAVLGVSVLVGLVLGLILYRHSSNDVMASSGTGSMPKFPVGDSLSMKKAA